MIIQSGRLYLLIGIHVIAISIISSKLYELQILNEKKFLLLCKKNYSKNYPLWYSRKLIVDRNGWPLVRHISVFHLYSWFRKGHHFLSPEARNILNHSLSSDTEQHLKNILELPLIPKKYRNRRNIAFHWGEISWNTLVSLRQKLPLDPTFWFQRIDKRQSIYGALTAHWLGYVPVHTKPHLKIRSGQNGIEQLCEDLLQIPSVVHTISADAHNNFISWIHQDTAQEAFSPLRISLDIRWQKAAAKIFDDAHHTQGAAVVMHIPTGEVVAAVSYPTFDPKMFESSGKIQQKAWESIKRKTNAPLLNRVVSGQYPPGSIVKVLMALAALQEKIITPETQWTCKGKFKLNDHTFYCVSRHGHGVMNVEKALIYSCDVFFYQLGLLIKPEVIERYAYDLGLGVRFWPEWQGQKSGFVPSPKNKWNLYKKKWYLGDNIQTAIGQGLFLATPLHMATLMARIASGKKIIPSYKIVQASQPLESLPFNEKWLTYIRSVLLKVVKQGTGRLAWSHTYPISGKTSTSQIHRFSEADRKFQKIWGKLPEVPWKCRDHALFSGYYPAHHPQWAFCIIIEHGTSGGKVAAPLVLKMIQEYEASLE